MSGERLPAAWRVAAGRHAPIDLSDLLPLVEKPQRYAGVERLAAGKPLGDAAVTWALCFPEVYEIGMSHLGLKVLYTILNQQEGVAADRAFAPWPDLEAELRRRGLPLCAIESRSALGAFDVLGFSLQSEFTYTNVLTMLDLAGVPLRAVDRDERHPLVIGGGPNAANPEPLAGFFDAFVIGDGEEVVLDISELVRRYRAPAGEPWRAELLAALARVPGVYVPELYAVEYTASGRIAGFHVLRDDIPARVRRVWVSDLSEAPYPTAPVVPIAEVVQDRYAIEVLRGCTQGCRFCQAGYWYRPVRERTAAQVVELARAGVRHGGYDEVSLCSLSTADHSQVVEMTRGVAAALRGAQVSVSLPSLRADSFSVGIAEAAGEVTKGGFTFAPESGSERLRRVINKNITDAALLEAVETAYRSGWDLVKLYFMIGLPTETLEDVASIADLLARVSEVGRRAGRGKRVTASIAAHVPKAFTPFQWEPLAGRDELERKLAHLRAELARNRSVRLKWHDFGPARLEAVLSLGDRRLAPVIEAAWRHGARFDAWREHFDWKRWEAAFGECGVDPAWYTSGRGVDEVLPWDLIDAGVDKEYLVRERRKAAQGRTTGDCRFGACHRCGIPGGPADIRLAAPPPAAPPAPADAPATPNAAPTAAPPVPSGGASQGSQPGAPGIRMRVHFRVRGASRFISHHDLMRAFQRAIRMARVPVRFTHGFSPRPRVAFGPPLPMAIGGEREVCDIELAEPTPELIALLNRGLPDGLACLDASPVPRGTPSISAQVRRADYLAVLPPELVAAGALRERLAAFAAAARMHHTKSRPGKPDRVIDLKRAILGLELEGTELRFRLAVQEPDGHEAGAPAVLSTVLGLDREQAARVRVMRLAMRDARGSEL